MVLICHPLTGHSGITNRCHQFQQVLAHSELNEVSVMPFRENTEAWLPRGGFGGRKRSVECLTCPSVLVRLAP